MELIPGGTLITATPEGAATGHDVGAKEHRCDPAGCGSAQLAAPNVLTRSRLADGSSPCGGDRVRYRCRGQQVLAQEVLGAGVAGRGDVRRTGLLGRFVWNLPRSGFNLEMLAVFALPRGYGAVGSALRSHRRGQEFESP